MCFNVFLFLTFECQLVGMHTSNTHAHIRVRMYMSDGLRLESEKEPLVISRSYFCKIQRYLSCHHQ